MNTGYHIRPFPKEREIVVDTGRLGIRRPLIHGLLELDVSRPWRLLREHKEKTGENLSFTAFIVASVAKAVEAHPLVHTYRDWRGRLVWFDDVDVVTLIETQAGRVALPHIVRQANLKSYRQIHDEIRSVQNQPARSEVKNKSRAWAPYLPRFVRSIYFQALIKNPAMLKKISGTVVVTAVGMMFGQRTGWGVSFVPWHTLSLTIGSVIQKPGVWEGRIELRDYLCVTVSLDHDIVDGAPAARFARSLSDWMEGGGVLEGQV